MEAVARGFRLPAGLKAWSEFDYVDGDPGPWVSREKFKLIERFKFFSELAARPAGETGRAAAALCRLPLPPRRVPPAGGDAVHPLAHARAEAVMSEAPRVLLVNPTMTPARNARFPLAILNLAAALEGRYPNAPARRQRRARLHRQRGARGVAPGRWTPWA